MVTLKQLEYFVAVAENLNFRRAADKLFVSQPSLSQQIKKLEYEVGVQLVERDHHHVALTDAGEDFLEDAQNVLALVTRAVKRARQTGGADHEQITIGLPGALAGDLVPLVERFRRQNPTIVFEILELTTPELIKGIKSGRVTIGLADLAVNDKEVGTQKVMSIPFVVAVPTGHPFADLEQLHLTELADEPQIMIMRSYLPPLHDYMMGVMQAAGVAPTVVRRANHFQQVMSLVATGVGVNLCPATHKKVGRPGVVFVDLADPQPKLDILVTWNKRHPPAILDIFLESVQPSVDF